MSRGALDVPLRAILIAIAIHTLWGANPVAVKYSLLAFPPMWTAFLRFIVGIACILVWAWIARVRVWPSRGEWSALLVIGVLFTVQIGLMNVGFDHTTGAMGAVIIATNPIFAGIFAHFLVAGDRMSTRKALGLSMAMAGVAVVLLQDASIETLDIGAIGNWILLASACMLGLRLSMSARVLQRIDEVRIAIWQMAVSLPLFAAGGAAFETIRWEQVTWGPIAGILYQGAVVAGLAFMVNFWLMKRYTPSVMMSFNFVSPIAGVLLSAWLLGDVVGPFLIAGMLLVAAGLYLVARRES